MAPVRRGDVLCNGLKASGQRKAPARTVSGKSPAWPLSASAEHSEAGFFGPARRRGLRRKSASSGYSEGTTRGNSPRGQRASPFGDWTGWWAPSYRVCASHAAHHRACGFPRGSTLAGLRIISGWHSCRVRFPATPAALSRAWGPEFEESVHEEA